MYCILFLDIFSPLIIDIIIPSAIIDSELAQFGKAIFSVNGCRCYAIATFYKAQF